MFMDDVMNDAWINTNIKAHIMIKTFRIFEFVNTSNKKLKIFFIIYPQNYNIYNNYNFKISTIHSIITIIVI